MLVSGLRDCFFCFTRFFGEFIYNHGLRRCQNTKGSQTYNLYLRVIFVCLTFLTDDLKIASHLLSPKPINVLGVDTLHGVNELWIIEM